MSSSDQSTKGALAGTTAVNNGSNSDFSQSKTLQGKPRRRTTLPRSTRGWSRGIIWTLLGLTGFGVIWGSLAKIDTSINTVGKLGSGTTNISPPFNGLVSDVLVKDGDKVIAGQPLVLIRNPVASESIYNLNRIRNQWLGELESIRTQLGLPNINKLDPLAELKLAASTNEVHLRLEGNKRLQNKFVIEKDQQLADVNGLTQQVNLNLDILERQRVLFDNGAIAQIDFERQLEQVIRLKTALRRQELEVLNANERIEEAKLTGLQISAADKKQLFARYDNARQQYINLSTNILEQEDRKLLHTLKAPNDGIIFSLNARIGEIVTPNRPTLQILGLGKLTATLTVPPKDIGFVEVGMPVEIRIDSYPFTMYGSIMGELESLSVSSLPPDNTNPQERFSATVALKTENLEKNGELLALQSGMGITGLIKTGQVPVISLITDRFNSFFDGVTQI